MNDLLNNGVEKLSDTLRIHSNTKTAFKSIAGVIEEILELVEGQSRRMLGSLRKPKCQIILSYIN